jgi:hypothetical protein
MSQVLGTHTIDTAWVHIAYTREGTTHKLYLNGDLEVSSTQDVTIDVPAILLAYTHIVADSAAPTKLRQTLLTGVRSWNVALTRREIGYEITAGQRASRRTNLYNETWLTDATDTRDHSGNTRDWFLDDIKSGTLVTAGGPKNGLPVFNRLRLNWGSRGTAVASQINSTTAIGDSTAIGLAFSPTLLTTFTVMGWFLIPTSSPTKALPLLRLANDDAVGGSNEISISLTTSGILALNVGLFPSVSAGINQIAPAPLPATVTLTGVVTPGPLFTSLGYLWQQTEGPTGNATIVSPTTLSTTITFAAFTPGTYVFVLTASFTNPRGQTIAVRGTVSVVVPAATNPLVQSGSQQIVWPTATTTLTPTIVDDGWGGVPSYLWEQVSGPAAAIIATPAAASTLITITNVSGIYLFRLTVRNSNYSGRGYWRVPVLGTTAAVEAKTPLDVVVTIGGVAHGVQLQSLKINEVRNEIANGCQLRIFALNGVSTYTADQLIFKEVIVTQGAEVIYAGHVNRLEQVYSEDPNNVFYDINLIGYEWSFMRRRVTKRYRGWSITDIAIDLIGRVAGFSTAGIDQSLEVIDEFSLYNQTIGEALTELARIIQGKWGVSYLKVVSLGVVELTASDPIPLTSDISLSFRDLVVTRDGTQFANRVISEGGGSNAAADYLPGATEIQVVDLSWFSTSGGLARVGAQRIAYTGVKSAPITTTLTSTIAGQEGGFSNSGVYESLTVQNNDDTGTNIYAGIYTYFVTYVNLYGESLWVDTFQISNGFPFYVVFTPPGFPAGILRMNIYRSKVNETWPVQNPHFVATLSQQVGALDYYKDEDIAGRAVMPTVDNSQAPVSSTTSVGSPTTAYFLTGVTGLVDAIKNGDPINIYVQVDDTAAQADVATRLGGGSEDGVIEAFITDNQIGVDEALLRAQTYLADHTEIDKGVRYTTLDQNTHPTGVISANLPLPTNIVGDFKIQTVQIEGFEKGVAPTYRASASLLHTPLEKLLSKIGGGLQSPGNSGGSSSGSASAGSLSGSATSTKNITRPTYRRPGWMFLANDSSASMVTFGCTTIAEVGTKSVVFDTTRSWHRYTSALGVNQLAGFTFQDNGMGWADHSPFVEIYFRIPDPTGLRLLMMLSFNAPLLTGDDFTAARGFGIRYSTGAADPGFVTVISTGAAADYSIGKTGILRGGVSANGIYRMSIQSKAGRTAVFTVNGSSQTVALLPLNLGVGLNLTFRVASIDGLQKTLDIAGYYQERY